MIQVTQLRKTYGRNIAVRDVTFTVGHGEVFGLLGPNGAGKSTIIGCLAGLVTPDSGDLSICGHDVRRNSRLARRSTGIVPQDIALYDDLSVRDNLRFWAAINATPKSDLAARTSDLLETFGLANRSTSRVSELSGGMKRRLNFACGIAHRPRALLLDEPTVGVDPESRERLLDLIRHQVSSGVSVLYTTHDMDEAERLCNRIAIVQAGHVVACGTLDELREEARQKDIVQVDGVFEPERVGAAFAEVKDCDVITATDDQVRLEVPSAASRLAALLETLGNAGSDVRSTTVTAAGLRSLFFRLTGTEMPSHEN